MVKMVTFQIEDALAKDIERIISLGSFSSRSEFIKDAIRVSLDKQREKEEWRESFDEMCQSMRKTAISKGWNGKMPTREERAKIADEYLKGLGLKYNSSKNQLEKVLK
ncbi:MAG: ribbon-helix-helix domain-containing protein [Candidatus ainarchaeum sp.]|nr:ribbon-helix-helix domain-containing protein [Candidatus ainarchaeum sp.]